MQFSYIHKFGIMQSVNDRNKPAEHADRRI